MFENGEGETRECHILLAEAGQHPTELYEAGPPFQPEAMQRLVSRLPAGQVAVCGSLAPGTTLEAFTDLLRQLDRPVVDSSGTGLQGALQAGAALIKPNEHELEGLTGSGTLQAAHDLYRRTGVAVLLTLGERGAVYIGQDVWEAAAPHVEVLNPVGSGDSLLGAFLHARQGGQSIPEALRLGVAAGSANALLGGPLKFRAEVVHELLSQVRLSSPSTFSPV
jgi:fructose-1-phosphate kinase PfkB-like protein